MKFILRLSVLLVLGLMAAGCDGGDDKDVGAVAKDVADGLSQDLGPQEVGLGDVSDQVSQDVPIICRPPEDCLGLDAGGDVIINMTGTPSDCCIAHPTPGCSDQAVQMSVCMAYTHCCNTSWDTMCAMQAQTMGYCSGASCGDMNCQMPSENCTTCPQDCACFSPAVCYTNTCCTPQCSGKACGSDGCGGTCGNCTPGYTCKLNKCEPDSCIPITEFCDALDNDCDNQIDEDIPERQGCDSTDIDGCKDGYISCVNGLTGTCREGLVFGFFSAGEGTTYKDISGNGNHPATFGTCAVSTSSGPEKFRTASGLLAPRPGLAFNGTDCYMQVTDSDSKPFHAPTDLTMTAWVRWDGAQGERPVLVKEDSYGMAVVDGKLKCAVKSGSSPFPSWSGAGTLVSGRWHHLVCRFLKDQCVLESWLDGAITSSTPVAACTAPSVSSQALHIGRRVAGVTGQLPYFAGAIDSVGIWSVPVLPTQLAAMATYGAAPFSEVEFNFEACDGLDNDCNGMTDEGFDFSGTCLVGGSGCQAAGTKACAYGAAAFGVSVGCSGTGKAPGTGCDDGNLCTKQDQCTGGAESKCTGTTYQCQQCYLCDGSGGCTADTGSTNPDCALKVDLGAPIGVVSFPEPQGPNCFKGTKQLSPCSGMPFCSVTAVACKVNGQVSTVSVSATAAFGGLGNAEVTGYWQAGSDWCMTGTMGSTGLGVLPGTWTGQPAVSVCVHLGVFTYSVSLTDAKVIAFQPSHSFAVLQGTVAWESSAWTLRFTHSLESIIFMPQAPAPVKDVWLTQGNVELYFTPQAAWVTRLQGRVPVKAGSASLDLWMNGEIKTPEMVLQGRKTEGLMVAGQDAWAPRFENVDITLTLNFEAKTAKVGFFGDGGMIALGRGLTLSSITGGGDWGPGSPLWLEGSFNDESVTWFKDTLKQQLGLEFIVQSDPCLAVGYGQVTGEACGQPVQAGLRILGKTGLPLNLFGKLQQSDYSLVVEDIKNAAFVADSEISWLLAGPLDGIPNGESSYFGTPVLAATGALQADKVTLAGHLRQVDTGVFDVQKSLELSGPYKTEKRFTATADLGSDLRPRVLRVKLPESVVFPREASVDSPVLEVVRDSAGAKTLGVRFQGEVSLTNPTTKLPVKVLMKYYEDCVQAYDKYNLPIPSPWFFDIAPLVTDFVSAINWIQHFSGGEDMMKVCTTKGCGDNDNLSIYPLQIQAESLDVRFASVPASVPPEADLGGGFRNGGTELWLDTWLDNRLVAFHGLCRWGYLNLTARLSPDESFLPTLFPGGVGIGLTHDPVNKVARALDPLAGKMLAGDAGNGPQFVEQGTVKAWVKNPSWTPRAYIIDRVAHDVLCDDLLEVSIYGASGNDGRLRVRVVDEFEREFTATTTDAVIPRDKLTHVVISWDRGMGRASAFVDGHPVHLDIETRQKVKVPADARFFIGTRLLLLDDLQWWSKRMETVDDMIDSKLAFLAEASYAGLAMWLRFDNDIPAPFPAFDETRNFNPMFVPSAGPIPWTAPDDVYLQFNLASWSGTGDPGFWLHSGAGLHIPLPGAGFPIARAQVRIGDGKAEGEMEIPSPLLVLPIVGPGGFFLTGRSTNQRSTAAVQLPHPKAAVDLIANTFTMPADLVFQRTNGEIVKLLPADVSFKCPKSKCADKFTEHVFTFTTPTLDKPVSFNLLEDSANGPVSLSYRSAAYKYNEMTQKWVMTLVGGVTVIGLSFLSNAIGIQEDGLFFKSSVIVGKILGVFDFGTMDLDLFMKYTDWKLCGSGTKQIAQGSCKVDVCFSLKGRTASVVCDGKPACTSDADCGSGKMCLGFLCAPKLPDWSPCVAASQCSSGACAGACYTPHAAADGQACVITAPDHCQGQLFCGVRCTVGTFGCGTVCMSHVAHGTPCLATSQCPAGATCTMPVFGAPKLCLYDDLDVGERCVAPRECLTNTCIGGYCRCFGTGGCDQGEYCTPDGSCNMLKADGESCCAPLECRSNRCSTLGCTINFRGQTTNRGKCYSPNSAPIGADCVAPDHCARGFCNPLKKCACLSNDDCPGKRCDLLSGRCISRLADGALCLLNTDCQSGKCGTLLTSLPECYSPNTRLRGEWCVAQDHCANGPCEIHCNFSIDLNSHCTPAHMFSAMVIAPDMTECGCESRCTCDEDSDCDSDQFCGPFQYYTTIVPFLHQCNDKLSTGSLCDRDGMCDSGNCGGCNFLGCWCLCGSSDDCGTGTYCSGGACLPKKPLTAACGSNGECFSNYCKSTVAGKYCAP